MAQEILISINVNSGKAEANLGNAKKSVDKLAAAQNRLKEVNKDNAVEIAKLNLLTKQQIAVNNQNAAALLKNTNKGSKQFRTQVGLNNAILQEAGRAASDARFGFNGVANNVGQLASLFGSLVNTSDNVGTSLRNLAKSLMGTGGVLIAVQLLIAYGDQIYKFFTDFATGSGILEEAFEGSAKQISSTVGNFEIYIRTLQSANKSQKEQSDAIHQLNKEFPDFIQSLKDSNVSLEDVKNGTDDATLATDLYRISIKELALSEAARAKITELQSEALQIQIDRDNRARQLGFKDYEDGLRKTSKAAKDEARTNAQIISDLDDVAVASSDRVGSSNENLIDTYQNQFNSLKEFRTKDLEDIEKNTATLLNYVDIKTKSDEKDNKSLSRRVKAFTEGLLNLQRIVDKYNKEADKINVRTLDEKLDLEEEYAKREADTKLSNFKEQQAKRLEEYKERVKDAKNAGTLIANAELEYQDSIEDAKIKHGEAVLAIEDGIITKRILAKEKEAQAIGKIERSIENKEIDRLKFSIGNNAAYFEAKIEQVGKDKENVDAQIANADALKLSDLEVANLRKESFNLESQQIDLNLQKEIASVKAKEAINMEYVGFAKGISQLMGTLAGEDEAMKKAALIVGKGAAIADIVIKTQAANAITVAQDTASLGATIPVTAPLRLRNNISAGISIANIIATTLSSFKKPSASGGGTSGGGGAQVQAPDFNVVGSSPITQLGGVIGGVGGLGEPVKAYVSGKDIIESIEEYNRNLNTSST